MVDSIHFRDDGISIYWSAPKVGFGVFTIFQEKDKILIDNECMSKEFIKKVLCDLVDNAELKEENRQI